MYQKLTALNHQNLAKTQEAQSKHDGVISDIELRRTIIQSFKSLVQFMDNKTSKVVVTNQLKSIGTPDAMKVVKAVNSLSDTVRNRKDIDLTATNKFLEEALRELKEIPKAHPDQIEQKFIDYSKAFKDMVSAVNSVKDSIEKQELKVESPVVKVESPIVKVDAPDFTTLEKGNKDVVKAVKSIKIPDAISTATLEKLVKDSNKLLKELTERPISVGGGGSSRVSPYEDSEARPSFVTLIQGGVPTVDLPFAVQIDDTDPSATYIGKAVVGTDEASPLWQISKLDTSSGLSKTWAANAGFTQVWADRASLTYL